ncbi:MAG: glutathione peroxidase [Halobacteriovoraceae bacterium]|nr:glutathione peroxidase [Halobacteriovoraceae bacterium]
MNIYDFIVKDAFGEDVTLEKFKGKKLIIVNTASKCGFTPQYKELEELKSKYIDTVEILAFPCNQFGGQEPGKDEEIQNFCELNYKISFPVFSKIEVNGENAHPLFNYLKNEAPGILGSKAIKWNFTKFLIDESGKVIKRFSPQTSPLEIESDL